MSTTPWAGKTVLVVDDSETMRLHLAGIYSDLGLRVLEMARNGIEALQLYQKHSPDLISLDIIMPEMHGIDCLRKLQGINPDLRYVLVSCLAADSKVIAAFEGKLQTSHLVPKPATYENLQRVLNLVFGTSVSATPMVGSETINGPRATVA